MPPHTVIFCCLLVLLAGCGSQSQQAIDSSAGPATNTAPAAPQARWDVPTFYMNAMPALGSNQGWIATELERASGGRIKLIIHEPGKLLKSPKEILDAVSGGEVQAGYASAVFWQDRMQAAPLFTAVPFGPEAPEYLAWMYYGGGMELYQEMYDRAGYNVKVLLCGISAPETAGWFRNEIAKPDDLQGKSMRIAGLGGQVMERLGMTTVQLPGREIYPNLDTGKIDAAEYSTPAADAGKEFFRIAPYNYFPGWHQQATLFELLVNKDEWNKLSAADQALVELTCRAAVTNSLAESEFLQPGAMRRNVDEHGVKVRYWSPSMLTAFEQAWGEVVEEAKQRDEFFAKVWTSLQNFRSQYRLWSDHGFLPRQGPGQSGQ